MNKKITLKINEVEPEDYLYLLEQLNSTIALIINGRIEVEIEEATLEHKIPLSKGGSNRIDNLSLSHDDCNKNKGNKL